ncbi:MAG: uracil-DNA glycosylase family protein [Cypionkella sp.]|nr:uracil-DNA glycosylase family protein [Cypionkella sp.]
MGITADIEADYFASLAALAWQVDLGADEAICEAPQSAYDLPDKTPWQTRAATPVLPNETREKTASQQAKPQPTNHAAALSAAMAEAEKIAADCPDLPSLEAAAASFAQCDLRKGARGAVSGAGHAQADLLVICDPPSLNAEKAGAAMDAGELAFFQSIFKAIGRDLSAPNPESALHLAPALPWPLRGLDTDRAAAMAMMRPFTLRRIQLIAPRVVLVMGHESLAIVMQTTGVARLRGSWHGIAGYDGTARARVMPDPASIAKTPAAKCAAWEDALAIKAALRE